MVRILITSAGGTNGINVIKALLSASPSKFFLVAADAEAMNPARHMADRFYLLPKASDSAFIPKLKKICRKENIRIVLPMYSAEILQLTHHASEFEKLGVKMAVPSPAVAELAWDKEKTIAFFAAHGIPHPRTYSAAELAAGNMKFPLFFKAKSGSGSKDALPVLTKNDLAYHTGRLKDFIVQECIGGQEYTIDALGDLAGRMVAASPRLRLEIKGGLATKSVLVRQPKLVRYAKQIVETLKIVGPVNIQCKLWNGKFYFIEINTRFASGGLPLAVRAGFNIPLIVVKMLLGKKPGKIRIRPGIAMIRYWDALFTDARGVKFRGFSHQFDET